MTIPVRFNGIRTVDAGVPAVNTFGMVSSIGETVSKGIDDVREAKLKEARAKVLMEAGQDGADYDSIGRRLIAAGEVNSGLGFLKLGQEEKARKTQAAADAQAFGLAYGREGNAPSYGTTSGTPRANIDNNTVHVAETEEDVQRLERATGQYVAPDLDKVVRTVYGEASNEGIIGQQAVASVIANRARQSGMTPTDVVLAKGQFEPWSDPAARARMESLDPSSPEYKQLAAIVEPALKGQLADPTGGATHFYAPKAQAALGRSAPSWDDGTGRDIGNHRFFNHGYGPQGKVQVAQADVPAPDAQPAQGFAIPGQAQSPVTANLERALANPNLSDGARRALQSRLDRAYKEQEEARKAEAEAPTTRQIKQQDGSEVVVQWDRQSRKWVPMPAPEGGAAVKGPPKLTETQSKDVGFYNRGSKIIDRLDKQDQALTDAFSKVGGNISNYLKTPEYRQAEQTAREFLAVILRKDTGAAVTPQEMEMYSSIYLPQPADDPTTIAQKKAARRTAIEGLRMGLGTAEILFSSQEAMQQRPTPAVPDQKPAPQGTAPIQGARQAPDGNWYVPDPNRPGKYLQVQ